MITQFEHRTPGNLRAFIQLKIKDAINGRTIEKRLNSADDIDVIDLDRRPMEYLYSDGQIFPGDPGPGFAEAIATANLIETGGNQFASSTRWYDGSVDTFQFQSATADDVSSVPEPASLILLGSGLIAVARNRWRTRAQQVGRQSSHPDSVN